VAEELTKIKCVPCEGGMPPMARKDFSAYLGQVEKWNILDDKMLEREFTFKNFKEALKFVNACGEIAEADGHHPNLSLHSWNKVKVTLYTHAIDGLSINDFVVAAKIDKIKI